MCGKQIDWSRRTNDSIYLGSKKVHVSVDGTDCGINEPGVFNPDWYSHKFHGPGVRYEIGISTTGSIVWVNGPFKCGTYPDIKIFTEGMYNCLATDEFVIADRGYSGDACITPDTVPMEHISLHKRIRARHETANERLKNFNVLRNVYRHDISTHRYCFHAVAELTARMLDTSDPLFQ